MRVGGKQRLRLREPGIRGLMSAATEACRKDGKEDEDMGKPLHFSSFSLQRYNVSRIVSK